jgi:hypothetical protein
MTPEETERMYRLCEKLQTEKNPSVFDNVLEELLELLEQKHKRIHPEHQRKPT